MDYCYFLHIAHNYVTYVAGLHSGNKHGTVKPCYWGQYRVAFINRGVDTLCMGGLISVCSLYQIDLECDIYQ